MAAMMLFGVIGVVVCLIRYLADFHPLRVLTATPLRRTIVTFLAVSFAVPYILRTPPLVIPSAIVAAITLAWQIPHIIRHVKMFNAWRNRHQHSDGRPTPAAASATPASSYEVSDDKYKPTLPGNVLVLAPYPAYREDDDVG